MDNSLDIVIKLIDQLTPMIGQVQKNVATAMAAMEKSTAPVNKAIDNLGVSFGKLVAAQISAQAIIRATEAVFSGLASAITESVKAASEAEKAHVQVAAALRAQGNAVPSVISAYEGYAAALQKTTIFQDDAIEGAEALLVQVGNVMPRDMEKALKATTELASGLGIDLQQATMLVAKAAEGNTAALKKAGVVLDETTAKGGDFGKVLDAITDKFGGQAAAIAGTYEGRLQQLSNTWNNVEESIGRVITQNATLLKAFDDLNRMIDANTGELTANRAITNFVSDAVIVTVRAVKLLAATIDTVQTLWTAFFITLRNGGQALGNIGVMVLEVANGLALMQGNLSGFDVINRGIGALKGAVAELAARNEASTQRSVLFGQALDTIGTKADELAKGLEATRGQTVALKTATDAGTGAWDKHTVAVDNGAAAQKAAAAAARLLAEQMKEMRHQLDLIEGSASKFELKTKGIAEGLQGLGAVAVPSMRDLAQFSLRSATDVDVLRGSVEDLQRAGRFGSAALVEMNKQIMTLPNVTPAATAALHSVAKEARGIGDAFEDALRDLPATLQRAFEGGGGLEGAMKSLGTKLAGELVKSFNVEFSKKQTAAISIGATGAAAFGGATGGASGATIGGLAASVAGPALMSAGLTASTVGGAIALGAGTAGIGAAAVGVYLLARHFLAVSQAEKDARVEFAKLQDLYGSLPATIAGVGAAYERMGHTGAEAQAALQRALDATHESAEAERAALAPIAAMLEADAKQTTAVAAAVEQLTAVGQQFGGTIPDAFKDAVRQLASMKAVTDDEKNALLALTKDVKPNFEQLTQTAAKYGVTLEGLGKSFQQAAIEGRAKGISADFEALVKAGGDAGGILAGMADEISGLVADSLKFGAAIPDNIRPLIDELLRAGRLTDEAGNKLEDLAGVSFENTPLDDSIQSLADAIKALTDALTGVKPALADVAGATTTGASADILGAAGFLAGDQYHKGQTVDLSGGPGPLTFTTPGSEPYATASAATAARAPVVVQVQANFDVKTYDAQDMQRAVTSDIAPRLVELVEDGNFVGRLNRALNR